MKLKEIYGCNDQEILERLIDKLEIAVKDIDSDNIYEIYRRIGHVEGYIIDLRRAIEEMGR